MACNRNRKEASRCVVEAASGASVGASKGGCCAMPGGLLMHGGGGGMGRTTLGGRGRRPLEEVEDLDEDDVELAERR